MKMLKLLVIQALILFTVSTEVVASTSQPQASLNVVAGSSNTVENAENPVICSIGYYADIAGEEYRNFVNPSEYFADLTYNETNDPKNASFVLKDTLKIIFFSEFVHFACTPMFIDFVQKVSRIEFPEENIHRYNFQFNEILLEFVQSLVIDLSFTKFNKNSGRKIKFKKRDIERIIHFSKNVLKYIDIKNSHIYNNVIAAYGVNKFIECMWEMLGSWLKEDKTLDIQIKLFDRIAEEVISMQKKPNEYPNRSESQQNIGTRDIHEKDGIFSLEEIELSETHKNNLYHYFAQLRQAVKHLKIVLKSRELYGQQITKTTIREDGTEEKKDEVVVYSADAPLDNESFFHIQVLKPGVLFSPDYDNPLANNNIFDFEFSKKPSMFIFVINVVLPTLKDSDGKEQNINSIIWDISANEFDLTIISLKKYIDLLKSDRIKVVMDDFYKSVVSNVKKYDMINNFRYCIATDEQIYLDELENIPDQKSEEILGLYHEAYSVFVETLKKALNIITEEKQGSFMPFMNESATPAINE